MRATTSGSAGTSAGSIGSTAPSRTTASASRRFRRPVRAVSRARPPCSLRAVAATPDRAVVLGLRANAGQFTLLVGVSALVGAMVGQERAIVPLLATDVFGLTTATAALSFLVAFGITKAVTNLVAGALADRVGRKPVLVAGWLVGLPVPFIIILAPEWGWIVAANVLLGVNQGLPW